MEIFKQGKLGKNEHDIYDELNNNGVVLVHPVGIKLSKT